jgi:hypothetical protein
MARLDSLILDLMHFAHNGSLPLGSQLQLLILFLSFHCHSTLHLPSNYHFDVGPRKFNMLTEASLCEAEKLEEDKIEWYVCLGKGTNNFVLFSEQMYRGPHFTNMTCSGRLEYPRSKDQICSSSISSIGRGSYGAVRSRPQGSDS